MARLVALERVNEMPKTFVDFGYKKITHVLVVVPNDEKTSLWL